MPYFDISDIVVINIYIAHYLAYRKTKGHNTTIYLNLLLCFSGKKFHLDFFIMIILPEKEIIYNIMSDLVLH